jgi:hypothetical protein
MQDAPELCLALELDTAIDAVVEFFRRYSDLAPLEGIESALSAIRLLVEAELGTQPLGEFEFCFNEQIDGQPFLAEPAILVKFIGLLTMSDQDLTLTLDDADLSQLSRGMNSEFVLRVSRRLVTFGGLIIWTDQR